MLVCCEGQGQCWCCCWGGHHCNVLPCQPHARGATREHAGCRLVHTQPALAVMAHRAGNVIITVTITHRQVVVDDAVIGPTAELSEHLFCG